MSANTNPFSVGGKLLGVNPLNVDTAQQHELGLELDFSDGTTRRYVRAGAAVAQYDALKIDFAEGINDWQPTAAALDVVKGVCPVSGVSDNNFFFAIVNGPANVKVAGTVAAGAHLAAVATAGTLDDIADAADAGALAAGAGVGVVVVTDDSPSAGIALVFLS